MRKSTRLHLLQLANNEGIADMDSKKAFTLLTCAPLGSSSENNIIPLTVPMFNLVIKSLINLEISIEQFLDMRRDERYSTLILAPEVNDALASRTSDLCDRGVQLAIELEKLQSVGIQVVTRSEENYPIFLRKRLQLARPPVLFYAGNLNLANSLGISIVGSRNTEQSSIEFAEKLVMKAVKEDLTIFSGGARGIDSTAEKTAINNNGRCVSIVPDTLARRIKVRENREAIVKNQLLLLSTANPYAPFKPYTAMERNKYIYVLSQAAFIVQSTEKKGGTWEGAIENLKNRWVPAYIRFDEKVPAGNRALIEMGYSSITEKEIEDDKYLISDLFKNNRFDLDPTKLPKSSAYTFDSELNDHPGIVQEVSTNKENNLIEKIGNANSNIGADIEATMMPNQISMSELLDDASLIPKNPGNFLEQKSKSSKRRTKK